MEWSLSDCFCFTSCVSCCMHCMRLVRVAASSFSPYGCFLALQAMRGCAELPEDEGDDEFDPTGSNGALCLSMLLSSVFSSYAALLLAI